MFVMAAIVATALFFPVMGLLALLARLTFGVSLHALVTLGGELSGVDGLVVWWAVMLIPALVYAGYVMPWAPKD